MRVSLLLIYYSRFILFLSVACTEPADDGRKAFCGLFFSFVKFIFRFHFPKGQMGNCETANWNHISVQFGFSFESIWISGADTRFRLTALADATRLSNCHSFIFQFILHFFQWIGLPLTVAVAAIQPNWKKVKIKINRIYFATRIHIFVLHYVIDWSERRNCGVHGVEHINR